MPCYFNRVKLFIILSNGYESPEQDSNLGQSRIAAYEDCKATTPTTQQPQLDNFHVYYVPNIFNESVSTKLYNLMKSEGLTKV